MQSISSKPEVILYHTKSVINDKQTFTHNLPLMPECLYTSEYFQQEVSQNICLIGIEILFIGDIQT